MLQSANADPHLSLVMPVPDGSELRFLATDKTMGSKEFMNHYWDLITSRQFNEDIYDEMFKDEWLALTKHFTTFPKLVDAVKNRHYRN